MHCEGNSFGYRLHWVLAPLFVLVLAISSPLFSQEFRGAITGQVTDPSGAVVPNATVTAIQHGTQTTYTTKTNGSGVYSIPYVLPGAYTVSASATGFKTQVQDNVVVIASSPRGLNFRLEVGESTQKVTVTSAPPVIDTTSASQNAVLTGREIENLPLNGRQVYMLMGTTPGSQFTQETFGATGFSGTRGWDTTNEYVLGGALEGYSKFTLNGTNITMLSGYGPEGSWDTSPNVDAIQEVNVMTNTYDARYGHTAGGTVNIVTKSGTNQFHGDAYDYLEAGWLNANNYENNLNGIPTQDTHQQQYGGTFGGPIKKDKLFFFGSFEGYWENIPFTSVTSVPTAAMRSGDFSTSGFQIYNPATVACASPGGAIGNCANNDYTSAEFTNDTIPAGDINKTGSDIVSLFPMPNINVNSPINNYTANVPDKYRYYQPMARVDYTYSDKTRYYATYEYQHGTEFRDVSGFTGPAENGDINTMRDNTVADLDMTHTFSPTLVGDFKAGFARFIDSFPDGPLSTPTPSSFGLTMPDVATTTKQLLPEITFSEDYANNGPTGANLVGNSVSNDVTQNIEFNGDFTKMHGSHTIEFGGDDYAVFYGNPASVGRPNGYFDFNTQFTQYNPTNEGALSVANGNPIADLLLGYPDSGGVDWNDTVAEGWPMWGFYGQDAWRVTHRFTLTYGLRYDVQAGDRERYDRLNRGMCTACVNPLTNEPAYQANVVNPANVAAWTAAGINPAIFKTVYGGMEFADVDGQPKDAYNTDWGNLAPRLGFAYAINNKTVVRGGWGYVFAYGIEAGTTTGFSISTPYVDSLNGGITPTDYFETGTPFPSGAEKPVGSSLGLLTALGNSTEIDFPQRKIPRSQIMSLDLQRALPGHMTLDVGYSGNYARALRTQGVFTWVNGTLPLSFDYPDLQQNHYSSAVASSLSTQVPNPYYGIPNMPPSSSVGSSPTESVANLMVPLSQFGLVGDYTNPYGKSWYDSLEVKLDKRIIGATRGLSMQLAYTYSKAMESTSYINGWPWQDPHPVYEPLSYDRTNVFSLAGEWDMPWGRGAKYFLSSASGPLGAIVNNWRLDWIFSDSTGFPEGLPGGFWYTADHSYVPSGGPTFGQWLYGCGNNDPLSCWTPIPSWGQGNVPNQVTYLRQPYIPDLDLTVEKNFPITESKRLEFRADFINSMNTPLFGGPDTNPYDGPPTRQANGSWSGFGTIGPTQQNFPRIIQLALKFYF